MSGETAVCRLIVGLGNPGEEYAGTRHNAGFEVVNRFLRKHERTFRERNARSGKAWEGKFASGKLILLKPMNFMNLSGNAVLPLVRGENLTPSEILVIYDDIDLPVGRMRLRESGGSAGHNGMKSVIEALGTENFPRLRIGIGEEGGKRRPDFVLSGLEGKDKEIFGMLLDKAEEAVEMTVRRGLGTAMNLFNSVNCATVAEETNGTK